jgi:hypothetical protein
MRREVNVLVNNLVQKFWPQHLHGATLRDEGNKLFKEGRLKEALDKYNSANDMGKSITKIICGKPVLMLWFYVHFQLRTTP